MFVKLDECVSVGHAIGWWLKTQEKRRLRGNMSIVYKHKKNYHMANVELGHKSGSLKVIGFTLTA